MPSINFWGFLILLGIGFVATAVMHWAIRYRHLGGVDGFFWKWIWSWLGAYFIPQVLGFWGPGFRNIPIIPAFIGAFVGAFVSNAMWKAWAIRDIDRARGHLD